MSVGELQQDWYFRGQKLIYSIMIPEAMLVCVSSMALHENVLAESEPEAVATAIESTFRGES
jgi:hypothetical protein